MSVGRRGACFPTPGLNRCRILWVAGTALVAVGPGFSPALADCTQTASTVTCAPPGTNGFVASGGIDGLSVTVQPGATVADNGAVAIRVNANNAVTNNGAVTANNFADGIRSDVDTNTVRNNSSIAVGDSSTGIFLGNGSAIFNAGIITAGNSSDAINILGNSTFINSGSITVGNFANGFVGISGNTVTNSGMITVGDIARGISLNNGNNFNNTGTIIAGNSGAGVQLNNNNVLVRNSGTIQGGTGGAALVLGDGNANVTNSGTLIAGNDPRRQVGALLMHDGNNVTNTGTIRAGDNNGTALSYGSGVALGSGNTFVNSGTISVGAFGLSFGQASGSSNGNQITNAGTVDGRIILVSDGFVGSSNQFTNNGVIVITNAGTPFTSHMIEGSFTQTAGGTLVLRVSPSNANGGYDRLRGLGDGPTDRFTLGGTLRALMTNGLYASTQTYRNVVTYDPCNCAPAMQGTFGQVATSSPFFRATATYRVNAVDLTLTRIPFGSAPGQTPNQSAVGAALEGRYSAGATGNAAALYQGLFNAASLASLDQLSGQGISAAQAAAFDASSQFLGGLFGQGIFWATEGMAGNGATAVAYAPGPHGHDAFAAFKPAPRETDTGRWRVWTLGFGSSRTVTGHAGIGAAAQSQRSAGGSIGIDRQLAPDLLIGAAIGGSESHFSAAALYTEGRINGGHLGLYAVKTWNALYASAAVSYARLDNTTSRTIAGVGPTEVADGTFRSSLLGARLELGWRKLMREISLTPFVAVEPSMIRTEAYTEASSTLNGTPGILGLSIASRSVSSLPVFVGAQIDARMALPAGATVSPYARLSWVHEFQPARQVSASFISVPGASFMVEGARAAADAARIDIGAKLSVNSRLALVANVTGGFSNGGQAYAASGGLRFAW